MQDQKEHANRIIGILSKKYPDAGIALQYKTPFQLLVVVILSAQSTDKQVNKLSPALFKILKTAKDFAKADVKEIEKYIYSSGFFRAKAKNIKAMAQMLLSDYGGVVPDSMEALIRLPGVARKTANVVLFNAFNKNEGIAVDTHVIRLSQRLGLSKYSDPVKIERDLMELFPKNMWGKITYYLIEHGRNICDAKRPKCEICPVKKLCPYFKSVLY
ncbi:MAG: endonuclease III [Candidatus Saganbacteria bacterium]|nr:endonuclease III [Candidatus Saganbacteria bacterium]